MLFSLIQTSQAELWEFVIELNVEKPEIISGDTVVVTGRVVDHAYKATRGVEVLVRTGADTTKAFTDPNGMFRAEFKDFQRVPGTYTVNVIASWYGMTGLASTEFLVKGDSTPVSILQQQLSTEQAIKYLSANESDFEKDPIGQTLYKYYHGLLNDLIAEQKEAMQPNEDQIFVEQQRRISEALRKQAIEDYQPGGGMFEGFKYDNYIQSLNPEIQDMVTDQLNYTKNNVIKAQKARDEILANGGTYEEARQAYLDLISIPKHMIEQFNEEYLEESKVPNGNQTSAE
ncbi:carboxypeptidase regulatory-like domain-containing protein [Nitrosopumilus sp.]|uniref:carboxypeptidase regulatory-like domain-containing protein n=1 Tax=Nitrosopumilus sp. TaxID=2024843 RepID=UPI00247C9BF5|nr:carboxypeptidase regulatory-like domain-containing protein [Nitrosopumilus sp.]MCV0431444.1 carboxypeptidase regulatory-like domain-containing protein [Nitrosopumilus sp.]